MSDTFQFQLSYDKNKDQDQYLETFKWHVNDNKYEIHAHTLEDIDLGVLLTHCVEVSSKIRSEVTDDADVGPSLFKTFERTLSIPLRAVWSLIADQIDERTSEAFDDALREFIAAHATEQDRHELVQQLLHPVKPRSMRVQAFYYRLMELNTYVDWLPGTDAKLTEQQLKRAFYDGMPATWRERFVNAGKVFSSETKAQIIRYFRSQEMQAISKQQENTLFQRRNQKQQKKKPNDNSSGKSAKSTEGTTGQKRTSTRVDDGDSCPVHPGSKHTWGECRLNVNNSNKKPRNNTTPSDGKRSRDTYEKKDNMIVEPDQLHGEKADEGTDATSCFIVETMVDLDAHLTVHTTSSFQIETIMEDVSDVFMNTLDKDIGVRRCGGVWLTEIDNNFYVYEYTLQNNSAEELFQPLIKRFIYQMSAAVTTMGPVCFTASRDNKVVLTYLKGLNTVEFDHHPRTDVVHASISPDGMRLVSLCQFLSS